VVVITIVDPALTVESNDLWEAHFVWLNPRQADPRAGRSNEGTRGVFRKVHREDAASPLDTNRSGADLLETAVEPRGGGTWAVARRVPARTPGQQSEAMSRAGGAERVPGGIKEISDLQSRPVPPCRHF
jgi:hypothetical protein